MNVSHGRPTLVLSVCVSQSGTHVSCLLVSHLQLLLGVLQGLRVLVQLILCALQLLLHLNQLIFMLQEGVRVRVRVRVRETGHGDRMRDTVFIRFIMINY